MVSAMGVAGRLRGYWLRLGCYGRDAETDVAKVLGARDKAKAGKRKKSDLGMVEER